MAEITGTAERPKNPLASVVRLLSGRKRISPPTEATGRELETTDARKLLLTTAMTRLQGDDVVVMRQWPDLNNGRGIHDDKFVVLTTPDGKINIALATLIEAERADGHPSSSSSIMPSMDGVVISWWEAKGKKHGSTSYLDDRKRSKEERREAVEEMGYVDLDGISFVNKYSTWKEGLKEWKERSGVFCGAYPSPSDTKTQQTLEELGNLEGMIRLSHLNPDLTRIAMEFHRDKLGQAHINGRQLEPWPEIITGNPAK